MSGEEGGGIGVILVDVEVVVGGMVLGVRLFPGEIDVVYVVFL